jgi:hypothetical protein
MKIVAKSLQIWIKVRFKNLDLAKNIHNAQNILDHAETSRKRKKMRIIWLSLLQAVTSPTKKGLSHTQTSSFKHVSSQSCTSRNTNLTVQGSPTWGLPRTWLPLRVAAKAGSSPTPHIPLWLQGCPTWALPRIWLPLGVGRWGGKWRGPPCPYSPAWRAGPEALHPGGAQAHWCIHVLDLSNLKKVKNKKINLLSPKKYYLLWPT